MNRETVLAVIVIFNKKIEDVPCINNLISWMDCFSASEARFKLMSCLIYDNSKIKQNCENYINNKSLFFAHDPLNGGTRAAYLKALQLAENYGYKWILFLDHDTNLPIDFFSSSDIALTESHQENLVCAVVPLIFDGSTSVSPTLISKYGSGRPWTKESKIAGSCNSLTAISSAALVRASSLASVLPIPIYFSLDYLDHWLFRSMQNRGEYIVISTSRVAHSLSIQSMHSIDAQRYKSILIAEFQFLRSGGGGYHFLLHAMRLTLRAVKLMLTTRRLDLVAVCFSAALNVFLLEIK